MNETEEKWLKIGAIIFGALIAFSLISFIFMPFLPWFEQREAGQETMESQMDSENAIQQYEEFRRLYHEIEAQRSQVENAYEEEDQFHETYGDDPSQWSREAETRHGRIHERITGNKNQLENLVADYNAQSDMAHKSVFKCHLPYMVDERFAIEGPPGSDAPDEPQDTGPDGEPISGSPPPAEECDGLPKQTSS